MAGAAAGVPAVVRVVEEIKNAVGTCGFASPPEVDLRLGITADGRYVFVIREAVQCALLNLKAQANKALEGKASQDLAQKLGIGSLATERWPGATHAQATCEVRHIGQVLTWALSRHGGTRWLPDDARVALVTTVQKTVCDLALSALTRSTGSIGVDIAGVDAEVRRLRADLESEKEDLQEGLQRTHTELAAVQAEANRVSLALTGVKQDLEREGRTCKSRSCAGSLKPQLVASQEYNNVAEERAAMQCHNKISRKKQAVAKRTAEK